MKRKTSNADVRTIVDKLISGSISSWIQVEMEMNLIGLDVGPETALELMDETEYNTNFFNMLFLLEDTVVTSDSMDFMFEDVRLIDRILMSDGRSAVEGSQSSGRTVFSAMRTLMALDIRNPRYLLKYFLKGDIRMSVMKLNSTFDVLCEVLRRTETRMKCFYEVGNGSFGDRFRGFRDRLNGVKDEISDFRWSMN